MKGYFTLNSSLAKLSICVALPSFTALFVYFWHKKNSSKSFENDFYTNEQSIIKTRQTIIELRVPNDCVRAIIGQQGCVIKEIQQKTNTRINFKQLASNNEINNNNNNNQLDTESQTSDRILLIRGSSLNCQRAELEIKRLILDTPMIMTEEFYVPEYTCGRIIGRAGSNIKQIRNLTNVNIKIAERGKSVSNVKSSQLLVPNESAMSRSNSYSSSSTQSLSCNGNSNALYKSITLSGSVEQIEQAKELIASKVREEEAFREKKKHSQRKRDNFKSLKNKFDDNHKSNSYEFQYEDVRYQSEKVDQSDEQNELNSEKEKPKTPTWTLNQECASTQQMPAQIDLNDYLDSNNQVNVLMSAVADPATFWVQVSSVSKSKLVRLVKQMSEFYSNNSNDESLFIKESQLKEGMLVACLKQNDLWQRAEIKGIKHSEPLENKADSIDSSAPLIDVYFVDFGDSIYLPATHLRHLLDEFYEIPLQAVECSLHGIEEQKWTDESIDFFEQLVYSNSLKLTLVQMQEITYAEGLKINKPSVDLVLKSNKNRSVLELLIENGFAINALSEKRIESIESRGEEEKIPNEQEDRMVEAFF